MIKTYAHLDDTTVMIETINACYRCGFRHKKRQHINTHQVIDENHSWMALAKYNGFELHAQEPRSKVHVLPRLDSSN